jgi:DNA-binding response OmpR family regulator
LANETTPRERVILAIEDDLEDVEILRLALRERSVQWKVVSVQFAKDAILYLGRVGEFADEKRYPWPAVIVLDLALPGMSGMDFLTWARGEKNMPPIVILSYSRLEENRTVAKRLGAKGYFVKSPDLKETAAMVEALVSLSMPLVIPPEQTHESQNPD